MDEQINFGISGDVSIKGTNSIKDLNEQFSNVLKTVQSLKDVTSKTNEALKSTSVKNLISDSDVNKMLSSLDGMFKKVEAISDKTFEQLGQNIEASLTQSFETAFKKYDELSKKYAARRGNELAYSQYKQRQNQSYGFLPITNQVSQKRFSPAYDEISAYNQRRQKSMLALTQYGVRNSDRLNREASDRRIESMVRKMRFEEKTGITDSMSKEIEDYDKLLSELAAKHNEKAWSEIRKDTETAFKKYDTTAKDKYYKQQHDKRVKDRYYREQHNERYNRWENSSNTGNWYTLETGFTMGPNREPYGEGQQLAEKIHQAQRERAELEQRAAEQTREHFRKVSEQSKLLLTADAGIKKIKDENLSFEEELVDEKEQQVKAEKENTKKAKEMTAYQNAKIQVADNENKIRQDRNDILRADVERKSAKDNSGYQQYKNAHPELFAVGALYHSKRYQTGHMFQTLGGVASSLGSGGRAAGLALDSLGAFFKAVPFGIATTISNLAKGITELGKASVQAYSEIEAIKTQLGVVFSNQTQADSMFSNISQYAVKSPFGVQQTSELAVLLKQSGVYASDLMNTLKMLGDTAGGNMEKMKRIANNYAQIVSIGKASMLDMRQFAYAGIPIFEAVSKELGVSQQELRKLISEGKVTADIVEKVFKDLTGINGIFENATEKGARTLKARLQNLADARQLAIGSLGERVVSAGTQYGNDGAFLKFVSTAESFYTWMKEHNDIKNIERDVNTIATSNQRLQDLESLLKYAKETGDKEAIKIIEAAIKAQKSVFDPDKIRSILVESYDQKNSKLNAMRETYGYMSIEELQSKRSSYKEKQMDLISQLRNTSDINEQNVLENQIQMYVDLEKAMKDYLDAINEANKTTKEEIKANRERNLIDKQQSAYDQAQKEAGKEGSYSAAFDKLYSLETSSAEYKKKKEEEEIKFLKEAQSALKKLADFVDENGTLDMTKLGYKEFSSFYNDKHAFDPNKKLTIVEGKSEAQMTADREVLTKQWNYMSDMIAQELSDKGQSLAVNRMGVARRMYSMEGGDNKTWFANFDNLLNHQLTILEELAKNAKGTDDEKYYQDMINNLLASTFQMGVNTKGANANPEDLIKGSSNEFIPLWKRILAGATGLSTQGMTGTEQTLKNYRDDMAIRNMTAGVLSATLRTMGVDSAMSLVKTSGYAKQLRGDASNTFQVDWQKTRQSVKDFSLSLSAATEVVSAYKKGLEDELEVYQQLIVAGYTESESQDLKNQKTVSSKTMAKLAMDSGEQLVNAFGEILTTKSGKQYNVSDISIVNGQLFDKLGNPIEEEVVLTGRMFEFIKQEMPRLYEELHEANLQEQNNAALEKMFGSLSSTMFTSMMIKEHGVNNSTRYIANNPEYMDSLLKSGIAMFQSETLYDSTKQKSYAKWDKLQGLSVSDILLAANNYKEEKDDSIGEQASAVVGLVIDSIVENLDKLLNSSEYQYLAEGLKNQNRDNAVNTALLDLTSFAKNISEGNRGLTFGGNVINSSTSLSPEDYEGPRGARNYFAKYGLGYSQDYDLEDLYIQAAKTENIKGSKKNQFGIDSSKFDQYKGLENEGELILKNLEDQEKAWIRIAKAQQDSASILLEMGNSLTGILADFGKGILEKPTEQFAKNMIEGKEASEGMDKVFKNLSAEILNASGQAMIKAGWELVARGAADKNYAMIAGGLALAGAGAFANGVGKGLSDNETKESEDKAKRLEDLKNNIAELLKQAREDAIYYEKTLRHKKAVSANEAFTKSVNDAIITPRGDIVTTDPKDYLIATKTPKTLVGGGAPTINFSVVDKSTGIKVTQQRSTYNEETNTIEFEAIIESKVQEVIATSKGDEAFAARQARLSGRSVVA